MWIALALVTPTVASAQPEVGKAEQYFRYDVGTSIGADQFPQLSIADLRRVAMYSHLTVGRGRARIADKEYMRRVESYPGDKDVLIVVSDHFRFTVLKDGRIPAKAQTREERLTHQFLWIKHATRETAPDGRPWLKDMILLPYDARSGDLLGVWPFFHDVQTKRGEKVYPAFIAGWDPRPGLGSFPAPEECVIGTFRAGKDSYLVIDVFGGYAWWAKVAHQEFFTLRGKTATEIDAFFGAGKARGRGPPWVLQQRRVPGIKQALQVIGADERVVGGVMKRLEDVLAVRVRSEAPGRYADLLRLEVDDQPVAAIDELIRECKTLGDLLVWADTYAAQNHKPAVFRDWEGPLRVALHLRPGGYVVAMRVIRMAFRRLGFPAQLVGVRRAGNPLHPRIGLVVHVPSQHLNFGFFPFEAWTAFEPDQFELWALPNRMDTRRGRLPIFDCHLGGMARSQRPVRRRKY